MTAITTDVASLVSSASEATGNRKSRRKASVLALLQKPRVEPDLTEAVEPEPVVAFSAADLGLDTHEPPTAIEPVVEPVVVAAAAAPAAEGDLVEEFEAPSGNRRVPLHEVYEAPILATAVEASPAAIEVLQAAPEFSRPATRRFALPTLSFLPVMVGNVRYHTRQAALLLSRVDWVALATVATIPSMLALVYYFGAINAVSLILSAVAVGVTLYVIGGELIYVALFGKRVQVLRCLFSMTLIGLVWATLLLATGWPQQALVACLLTALIAPRLIKNW